LQPFDDDDDRSLIENCCIKEAIQQWDFGHSPQNTERAVRVYVVFTLLMFALVAAYRLQGEHEALGEAPLGWQRWRRQLREQTRDMMIVFAKAPMASFIWPNTPCCWGQAQDVPPGIGTLPEVLAKYRLTAHG